MQYFLLVTEFIFSKFEPYRLVDLGEVDEGTAKIINLQTPPAVKSRGCLEVGGLPTS